MSDPTPEQIADHFTERAKMPSQEMTPFEADMIAALARYVAHLMDGIYPLERVG